MKIILVVVILISFGLITFTEFKIIPAFAGIIAVTMLIKVFLGETKEAEIREENEGGEEK